MILLQESVHFIKMGFNERFLALRDLKGRIIKNVKQDNVRLRELKQLLNHADAVFEPVLDPAEWPEHREIYTQQDLDDLDKAKAAEEAAANNRGGGFGQGAAAAPAATLAEAKKAPIKKTTLTQKDKKVAAATAAAEAAAADAQTSEQAELEAAKVSYSMPLSIAAAATVLFSSPFLFFVVMF